MVTNNIYVSKKLVELIKNFWYLAYSYDHIKSNGRKQKSWSCVTLWRQKILWSDQQGFNISIYIYVSHIFNTLEMLWSDVESID